MHCVRRGSRRAGSVAPPPLETFIDIYTDQTVTSAQKEVGLKKGTWYEGAVTVCETRTALFKECEILEAAKPAP